MPRRISKGGGAGKGFVFWLIVLVVGALIGSIMAEIIGLFFQEEDSLIHKFFIAGLNPGFGPKELDLYVFDCTLGFHFKVNLLTLMGFIGAIYLGRLI